jgi:hypothetical protein
MSPYSNTILYNFSLEINGGATSLSTLSTKKSFMNL